MRWTKVLIIAISVACCGIASAAEAEAPRPNILFIMADDLAEQKNLIDDGDQAGRIQHMEQLYREIRSSKRSVPVVGAR